MPLRNEKRAQITFGIAYYIEISQSKNIPSNIYSYFDFLSQYYSFEPIISNCSYF